MAATHDAGLGIAPDFDSVYDKFRFERGMNGASLLARGRAFIIEAVPQKSGFDNYGMSKDIAGELTTLANAFEATYATTASETA